MDRDFLGGPVVEILCSNAGVVNLNPGQGAINKIPRASRPRNQNIKQE